jgi:hypothetical protein
MPAFRAPEHQRQVVGRWVPRLHPPHAFGFGAAQTERELRDGGDGLAGFFDGGLENKAIA